jgi:hypothetical protein
MDRDTIMQLGNDIGGLRALYDSIYAYYARFEGRFVSIFDDTSPDESGSYSVRFLLDRQHVVQYSIGQDRGVNLGALTMAIGPHYFRPADFWSYEAGTRFKIEASTDAVIHNLALLDEFLGYPDALRRAYGYKES